MKVRKKGIQPIADSLPIVVKVKHRWELILKGHAYSINFQVREAKSLSHKARVLHWGTKSVISYLEKHIDLDSNSDYWNIFKIILFGTLKRKQ